MHNKYADFTKFYHQFEVLAFDVAIYLFDKPLAEMKNLPLDLIPTTRFDMTNSKTAEVVMVECKISMKDSGVSKVYDVSTLSSILFQSIEEQLASLRQNGVIEAGDLEARQPSSFNRSPFGHPRFNEMNIRDTHKRTDIAVTSQFVNIVSKFSHDIDAVFSNHDTSDGQVPPAFRPGFDARFPTPHSQRGHLFFDLGNGNTRYSFNLTHDFIDLRQVDRNELKDFVAVSLASGLAPFVKVSAQDLREHLVLID